ncbi:MAG: class I SAM-dependent methyltransferase [Deltaproteobacteria bacterium]|nr:class I SAM-dependent methyltransferase [Deltaproteobacteria bacterium]
MLAFWPEVVSPLLELLGPDDIVEIGSESGKTTRKLLEFAREHDATVHAVDPAPQFDPDLLRKRFGEHFVLHRLPSLVALPAIARFDAVLIDGDHNWYTVLGELRLIEQLALQRGHAPPLVLLHDIGWPYGRRDLYYDPEAIPAEHRQPWARRGISLSQPELLPEGGFNAQLCNALREGGPRNGVLTAVEDYLAETSQRFIFARIPAVFGLGILVPQPLADALPELARKVEAWTVPEIARFLDRLEMARLAMLVGDGGSGPQ